MFYVSKHQLCGMPHRSKVIVFEMNDRLYTCFRDLLIKAAKWQKVEWKEKSITV